MAPWGFEGLPLDGPGRSLYEKPRDRRWQEAEVLITVKASPQPSKSYGDTVCVAGIRMTDEGPEWVRLYPVPFRSMEELEQFKKYEIVRLKIQPASNDYRAESFRPNRETIKRIDHLPPWRARHRWVSPLVGEWTMCKIFREQDKHGKEGYPSLAAIRPREISDLIFEDHPGWTQDQQATLQKSLQQDSLFGDDAPRKPLEAPRFRVKYHYWCEYEPDCPGHKQSIIDWELSELSRRYNDKAKSIAKDAIRNKFFTEMADRKRGPVLFVGNLMTTPKAFNVLGVYRSISEK